MPRNDITGFILAGGQSRRMGQDKAQVSWGKGTLLSHAVETVQRVASCVVIVGRQASLHPHVEVLPDTVSGHGPLAGIHAALSHTQTDWNLMLAIDMPLINAELLQFLLEHCNREPRLAIATRVEGTIEPLCAVYNRTLASVIEQRLQSGDLSIHHLFEDSNARIIEERELLSAGFASDLLLNVNTPEELERARTLAKTQYVD